MFTDIVRLISFSDNAEDVVLMRAFSDRPAGTFVDVGAGEPIVGSVTKNLSELLSWRGVHIEPQPEVADSLREHFPDDLVLNIAIGDRSNDGVLFTVDGLSGLATLSRQTALIHENRGLTLGRLQVPIVTMNDALRTAAVTPGFELLKVDIEGGEPALFEKFDIGYWRPQVIVAEVTSPMAAEMAELPWEAALLHDGYTVALFDGLNKFYVHRDEPELRQRLAVPANVFDRYVSHHWYVRMAEGTRPDVKYVPWQFSSDAGVVESLPYGC